MNVHFSKIIPNLTSTKANTAYINWFRALPRQVNYCNFSLFKLKDVPCLALCSDLFLLNVYFNIHYHSVFNKCKIEQEAITQEDIERGIFWIPDKEASSSCLLSVARMEKISTLTSVRHWTKSPLFYLTLFNLRFLTCQVRKIPNWLHCKWGVKIVYA